MCESDDTSVEEHAFGISASLRLNTIDMTTNQSRSAPSTSMQRPLT